VTMIHTGPSVMRALLEARKVPATVRVVNLGAEAVNRRLVERILRRRKWSGYAKCTGRRRRRGMRRGEG